MRKSVLLVNPNLMRPPVAPIGLEYLIPSLEDGGYGPHICDLTFALDWQRELDDAVESLRPDAVAVTIRNLDDAYFASQDFVLDGTAKMIRRLRETTAATVVLGGVGFSIAPLEVLRYTGALYGVFGEGEEALPDLLDCIRAGGSPESVPGAAYAVDGKGRVVAPRLSELNAGAAPRRRFFDNRRYFAEGGQAGIETKRGCPQCCIYCVEPHAKGNLVRLRSPKSVADEFADFVEQGINVFHLCDSEFNLPPEHARAVCDALVRRGLASSVRWYTYAYPEPFDKELARAMARAGCVGVNFGVDHVDEGILRRLGRPFGLEQIRNAAESCRDAGLALMFDMLLGSPGETHETLKRAIEVMRDIAPDRIGLSCGVRIYPNTPLAALVQRQGPLDANPNLHGIKTGNDDLLKPIFFVDADIGAADGGCGIHAIVSGLVASDKRFLHADPSRIDGNYNYNDNSVLANAIRAGARGAYWDILRRIDEGVL